VAIARALVNGPEIIIADEPTSNIDEETGKHILGVLSELRTNGVTVLVATHDTAFERAADKTFKMRDGRIE
jgi:putative ABC transport system ATP-binding protein